MPAIDVVVENRETGQTTVHTFQNSEVRLGRSPINNLAIDRPFISSYHAVLQFDGVTGSICDLGSLNGTVVDSVRLTKDVPVPITVNSRIQIGTLHITLRPAGMQFSPGPAMPAGLPPSPLPGPSATPPEWNPVPTTPNSPNPGSHASFTPVYPQGAAPPVASGAAWAPAYPPASVAPAGLSPVYPQSLIATPSAPPVVKPASRVPAPPVASPPMVRPASHPLPPTKPERPVSHQGGAPAPGRSGAIQDSFATCLEAFVRSFLELRKGYQAFGQEMGLTVLGGNTPLYRSQTQEEILQYLLDPAANREARLRELSDVFRVFMSHELALLNGVKAGVRELIKELDPETVDSAGKARKSRSRNQHERYIEHYQQVTEDDGHSHVFGLAFQQAYANSIRGKGKP